MGYNKHDYKKETFSKRGPTYLVNNVDWRRLHDRRALTASLVKGVYVLEGDRHREKKKGMMKLAPPWWENINFTLVEVLRDDYFFFEEIYGAIFKYNSPNKNLPPDSRPPEYVIAFRGTILKFSPGLRDLYLDIKLGLEITTSRFPTSIQALQKIVSKVGVENVWLAGHSLGAATALQVGKTMAKDDKYITETYLFNPPRLSLPVEMLDNTFLETLYRFSKDIAVVVVGKLANDKFGTTPEHSSFNKLRPWFPYLFVNRKDPICCGYIGYFKHRRLMEIFHVDGIQKMIERNDTLIGVLRNAEEALHQIPSATLIENDCSNDAHDLCQWWESHSNFKREVYQF